MSTNVLASRYIHTRVSPCSSGGTRTPRGVHRVFTHALADNVQPHPTDTSSKFPQASVYLRRARDVFVAAAVCVTLSSQVQNAFSTLTEDVPSLTFLLTSVTKLD